MGHPPSLPIEMVPGVSPRHGHFYYPLGSSAVQGLGDPDTKVLQQRCHEGSFSSGGGDARLSRPSLSILSGLGARVPQKFSGLQSWDTGIWARSRVPEGQACHLSQIQLRTGSK